MDQLHSQIYYYYLFLSNKVSVKYNLTYLKSYLIQSTVLQSFRHVKILPLNLWDFYQPGQKTNSCIKMSWGMIVIQVLTSQSTVFQSCCHVKISPLNLWDFYPTWVNNELKSCIKLLVALSQRHKAAHLLRRPQWAGA